MRNYCVKCGNETDDSDDLHCRRILVAETTQLLSLGEIEKAECLVFQAPFDKKWKKEMFDRLSVEPKRERVRLRQEIEAQEKLDEEEQIKKQLLMYFNHAKFFIESGKFREAETHILDKQMSCPNLPLWEKYVSGLRNNIPENFRLPIQYTARKEWKKFEDIRSGKELFFFVHVTDSSNIESIIKHGGLYSKHAMDQYNINARKYASNDLSWSLDNRRNLEDYIHLSIQKSPMMYNAGINPITLQIDSRFIFAQETHFSDKNSTDSSATIGSGFQNFESINFQIARTRWSTDEEKKLFQAEILIKHHIPLEFIYK